MMVQKRREHKVLRIDRVYGPGHMALQEDGGSHCNLCREECKAGLTKAYHGEQQVKNKFSCPLALADRRPQ